MEIVPAALEAASGARTPPELRLALTGARGFVRGRVIEGAVGPTFEVPVDQSDRRPAVLAITRVR
jgi:hypothetical protein